VDHKDVRERPQADLLCGLSVRLAGWAVPAQQEKNNILYSTHEIKNKLK